ncbi:hypothetical protein CFC21_047645 [Triticum aestivum]|uniref:F-box domain-containing protein n=2 Tax=Triticum aestivum TaxID=4565 RepID=A0A9R1K1A3_WHEAT|nr:putative F-box protein At3g16210 isoform X1 [Triticum aestivum]XP_044357386.1 putative F-box protein At3g16210 isoform X1 [Triticum aestivum]KAF7037209.1 hypothetical protein CFC21_047645 [Triticum aestivum]
MALVAAQLLPDGVLASVLRRLAPRSLAASRCVCKSWCDVVDDWRLLRTDLLPLSLSGIFFMEEIFPALPKFFASPSIDGKIAARLDYLDTKFEGYLHIMDHCNGLLLLWDQLVVNPATRQWVRLPHPPCAGLEDFADDMCLAFDPTVSPHYEVLLLPKVPHKLGSMTVFTEESEWPPSWYTIRVFSSRTWTWEERVLVRRGEAAGAIADMQSPRAREPEHRYTVYWKGELYVHCQNDSIMRITLSNGEYEVIKPPTSMDEFTEFYIGKSKKGLYCALIYKDRSYRLQVWLLSELRGKMEWGLKIDTSLVPVVAMFSWLSHEENSGPWILHGGNYDGDGKKVIVEDKCEWDFNNGILLEARDGDECDFVSGSIYFLGFHPYDEIAFLWVSRARVVAYHLSSSKVQDLGMLHVQCVGDSFPYTPYWTGELFEKH